MAVFNPQTIETQVVSKYFESQLESEGLQFAIPLARKLATVQYFLQIMKNQPVLAIQSYLLLGKAVAVINASSLNDLEERRAEVHDLFFRTLYHCHYDRSLITQGSPLEVVLDPALHSAQPDRVDPVTGRRIRETVAEALFARRLGVRLEKAHSDWHDVYYFSDRAQKRLGVFKPPIVAEPHEDRYGASEDREAHLAEAANSVLDKYLGTKVVPHTQLIKCDLSLSSEPAPVRGSFQFYVEGACDLDSQVQGENFFDIDHEALALRLDVPANRDLEFGNFEEFALFDFLTANNDHHFKNIFLKKGMGNAWDMIAIDNANSFPWCHDLDLPAYKMHPNHWFKWSTLPHARQPFSDAMIQRINALDMDRIEEIMRRELIAPEVPSSEEHIEGKIRTMRDRVNRIKLLVNQKASLRDIAKDILTLSNCSKN